MVGISVFIHRDDVAQMDTKVLAANEHGSRSFYVDVGGLTLHFIDYTNSNNHIQVAREFALRILNGLVNEPLEPYRMPEALDEVVF